MYYQEIKHMVHMDTYSMCIFLAFSCSDLWHPSYHDTSPHHVSVAFSFEQSNISFVFSLGISSDLIASDM